VTVASQMERIFRRYREDPVAFCHDMFPKGDQPREQQVEILHSIFANRATLVAAHRSWGKSRTAAFAVLARTCTQPNSLTKTLAPIWPQVIKGVWKDVRYLWSVSKLPRIFPTWEVLQAEIKTHPLTPKWSAIGHATAEVQNIEGEHSAQDVPAFIVADECKAIGDEFRVSAEGMMKHPDAKFFGIGTPGIPAGWFYKGFTTNRSEYTTFQFRGDESPDPVVRAHVQRLGDSVGWDDPFFKQQWLAEFTGADDGAVIPYESVQKAINRKMAVLPAWQKVAALDVAGESIGGDENVLTLRHGPVIIKQISWGGQDEMQTAARAVREAIQFGASILVVDKVGIGAGVKSRCRELAPATLMVVGFSGGSGARDREQFANIKTEEAFLLRKRFQDGEISIPDDPVLIGQVCSWTKKFNSSGRVQLVDPPDSPDNADSLLMAFAADRLGQSIKGVSPAFLR
jgi:hypothetical protein